MGFVFGVCVVPPKRKRPPSPPEQKQTAPKPQAEAEGLTINISSGSGDLQADRSGKRIAPPSRLLPPAACPRRIARWLLNTQRRLPRGFAFWKSPTRGDSARAVRGDPPPSTAVRPVCSFPSSHLKIGHCRLLFLSLSPLPRRTELPNFAGRGRAVPGGPRTAPHRLSVLGAASAPLRTKPP